MQRIAKYFLQISLFLSLILSPAAGTLQLQAQGIADIVQMDEDDDDGKKKKKKKDKDEVVAIDQRFMLSLAADIFTLLILIALIYYPNYHKREQVFMYVIFNIVIFLLTFVFNHVKMSMGAAFGLFAIFSMLRYRTEGISAKDMTYLFIVIAIGLVNAIQLDYIVLAVINAIVILITFILDGNVLYKRQYSKVVLYERIDMIRPEQREALIEDLRSRTGLNITKVTINKIDFLRDAALIEIFYNA